MKKCITVLVGITTIGGLVAGPALAASAAPETLGFGAESGGAAATTATQTSDAKTRAGNGSTWVWGVKEKVFSDYFHEGKCHGSTSWGSEKVRVSNVPAGRWSYALAKKKSSGNTAYYHVC